MSGFVNMIRASSRISFLRCIGVSPSNVSTRTFPRSVKYASISFRLKSNGMVMASVCSTDDDDVTGFLEEPESLPRDPEFSCDL